MILCKTNVADPLGGANLDTMVFMCTFLVKVHKIKL